MKATLLLSLGAAALSSLPAAAGLLYSSASPDDGFAGLTSEQLWIFYGATGIQPGWLFGAFDDTGYLANSLTVQRPIPVGEARVWSPMAAFSLSADGLLGTLSVPLNMSGVRGLRMEVYERDGSGFSLLDTSIVDGNLLGNGSQWVGFDFGADVALDAATDYFARLSLTEAIDRNIWQGAYWLASGSAWTGVRQSYNAIAANSAIPVGYGMPGGNYSIRATPGLHLTSESLLGSAAAIPEPATLLAGLTLLALLGVIGRRQRG